MDAIINILPELNKAFFQTICMVGIAILIALLIGMPLGIVLYVTENELILENRFIKSVAGIITNLVRSIPFIILLVFLLPFTNLLLGTQIGPTAAAVTLSIAAIPFFSSMVESYAR